jgi:flagellar protein FliS
MNDNHQRKRMNGGVRAYQKTEVLTANRETILLMLYAGATRFLRAAITATESGDRAEKGKHVARVQSIVSELRSTLDFKVGGELATNLEMLYAFITRRLLESATEDSSEGLREALTLLENLSASWQEAVAQVRAQANKTVDGG